MEQEKKLGTYRAYSCAECLEGAELPFEFTMAFQPIIDAHEKKVFSYEALVRGKNKESAKWVLDQVTDKTRYPFDQACRVKAIELASRLNISCSLNINFLPNAVYRPETCIRTTMEASRKYNFPSSNIILEVTEGEKVEDHSHLVNIFNEYRKQGLLTAIDDFGEGYSGLNLLAEFQPDFIKLDMKLIRNIHKDRIRQVIVKSICNVCNEIGIIVKAEGIESIEEFICLRDMGIRYYQGYFFAKPVWEGLAEINWNF